MTSTHQIFNIITISNNQTTTTMKKILLGLILTITTMIISNNIQAQDNGKGHKVVFQFVSADTLSQISLVNNLKNLRVGWPEAEVEVVFHGNGVFMVMTEKTKYTNILEDLVEKKQIKMVVCENTLRDKKIAKTEILPFINFVPIAIVELILKQEAGFSYIKAGL